MEGLTGAEGKKGARGLATAVSDSRELARAWRLSGPNAG
jgi:hypothetical protein